MHLYDWIDSLSLLFLPSNKSRIRNNRIALNLIFESKTETMKKNFELEIKAHEEDTFWIFGVMVRVNFVWTTGIEYIMLTVLVVSVTVWTFS